jgi:hypothetical protein
LRIGKYQKFVLLFLFLAIAVAAGIKAHAYLKEYNGYVEVCANGIAYVPRDAKFVKCYGKIRKVVRFDQVMALDEEDCKCPKCCDGLCYVFVTSGPPNPESDPAHLAPYCLDENDASAQDEPIWILWLTC